MFFQSALAAMIDAAGVLAVFGGLLIVVAIGQPVAARLRLPPSVLLAAVGVAIGGLPARPPPAGVDCPNRRLSSVCSPICRSRRSLSFTSFCRCSCSKPVLPRTYGARWTSGADPVACRHRHRHRDGRDRPFLVAARRAPIGRVPSARGRGGNDGPGGGHRDLPRRGRTGAAHTAGGGRGAAQ